MKVFTPAHTSLLFMEIAKLVYDVTSACAYLRFKRGAGVTVVLHAERWSSQKEQ